MIEVRAYAKLNLTLEVLGRRADGYHELRSVAQTLRLHDTLWLDRAPDWQVEVRQASAPIEDNLIQRAGRALERALGRPLPTRVRCEKRIPVAAGLGGGSADAAATLVGLRRLWGLRLDPDRLRQLAGELGSDVPLLLQGGTALLSGRGEQVSALPPLPRRWAVVAVPPARASDHPPAKTATMYSLLGSQHYTEGEHTARLAEALRAGLGEAEPERWNVFEAVADQVFPGLSTLRAALSQASGSAFRLSGAGPALYALLPDAAAARRCLQRLASQPVALLLTTTASARPRAFLARRQAPGGRWQPV
ncbi:MAG: 4-(cytidine 5'-diphospho)-2-C-methyl-D-erythritol kinase [Chloroflexi bacterium]|nr:4-(cytidine 5'-diphospho)-2-C-methyl-D-erythritol kinase [Chloroflexota bacterium]